MEQLCPVRIDYPSDLVLISRYKTRLIFVIEKSHIFGMKQLTH